jgi:phage terminase large subunit GpA-like protein
MKYQIKNIPLEFPQATGDYPIWSEPEGLASEIRKPMLPSDWSEKYRTLGEQSEEKGPLRLRRTPYIVDIVNAAALPYVETIVFCKPAQIAGTETGLSIIGYFIEREPCPVLVVLADEKTSLYVSRERIRPMFEDSPELKHLPDSSLWNNEEMRFRNGAFITIGWASSVARLGTRPKRIVILDEVDKPGYSIMTKEGSAISLARQRTETFYNSKIFILSTPTVPEGNVYNELNNCDDIRDYHVPCKDCGTYQPLRWSPDYAEGFPDGEFRSESGEMLPIGRVVWRGGKNATDEQIADANYKCAVCKSSWTTIDKNLAVQNGKWVSRYGNVVKPKSIGFHINRLYSLLGKSGDIPKLVGDFLDGIQKGPREMQTFVNSGLAEPWKLTISKTSEDAILKARTSLPPQVVPFGAVALTAGIDQQKSGLWFVVRSWFRDFTNHLIHYGFLPDYDAMEQLLFETRYPILNEKGVQTSQSLGIWRAALDIGGGRIDDDLTMTERAYYWLRKNGIGRGCHVFGVKGSSHPMATKVRISNPIDKTPSGKPLPGGLRIATIDTSALKDAFFYRLFQAIERDEIQPGYLHSKVGRDYARMITAEEKRLNDKNVQEWMVIRKDNHLLDAEVYASVVADPEWLGGGVNLLKPPKPKTSSPPKQSDRTGKRQGRMAFRRPKWLDRR